MVKPIRGETPKPVAQVQKTKQAKKEPGIMQIREKVNKFVMSKKSSLGSGRAPSFSDHAPDKDSKRVSQAIKGSVLSKAKKNVK